MKTNKNLIICMIFLMAILPLVSANLGTFKQNECINLIQTCSNCTYVNISSINYPNGNQAVGLVSMTKEGTLYNYTFCLANYTGQYIVNGYGDLDGKIEVWSYKFDVTGNGRPAPEGNVIVFFSILFIAILIGLIFLIIYSLGHAINLDFDIIDLAWNIGIYAAFIGAYLLADTYMGDNNILNILNFVVYIGAFTNAVLPVIYFILTLTIGSYISKRVKGVNYG